MRTNALAEILTVTVTCGFIAFTITTLVMSLGATVASSFELDVPTMKLVSFIISFTLSCAVAFKIAAIVETIFNGDNNE